MTEKQMLNVLMCIVNEARDNIIIYGDHPNISADEVTLPLIDTYNKTRKIALSKGWFDNDVLDNDFIIELPNEASLNDVKWAAAVLSQFISEHK